MEKPNAGQPPGSMVLFDTTLGIWFEHVDENAQKAFQAVKTLLNRRGFKLTRDPNIHKNYRCLSPSHRLGRRGELEVEVSVAGRHVEVVFFQNVYNVENRHGGRYDFDKLKRMPYLMKKKVQLETNKLAALMRGRFGLPLTVKTMSGPGPQTVTNLEYIERQSRESGHFKQELGRCDWHGDYNRRSADGQLLDQGATVYFTDSKGRWLQGKAFYNLNNMWWVACGRYGLANKGCFELHLNKPEVLREKRNHRLSIERVSRLIAQAVEKQDFLRAHQLKQVRDSKTSPQTN